MNPVSALDGAARMMGGLIRKYRGRVDLALAAYNAGSGAVAHYGGMPPFAETRNYVRSIMGGLGSPSATRMLSSPASRFGTAPIGPGSPGSPGNQAAMARLSSLLSPSPELRSILESTGLRDVARGLHPVTLPYRPGTPGTPGGSVSFPFQNLPYDGRAMQFAQLAAGADRPGVRTSRGVLQFVGRIGELAGRPLTIGTGTRHSRLTVNGRQSQHWTGHAADIPARGAQLIRLGQDALVAAGMSRAQARRQHGGLYNVGRYQIIFNTHEGGDHTNHLHVGVG